MLFLDDLQWTDPSTPDLLLELFSRNELRNLLVVGAFRDNEVHEGHLLELALRELRERAPDALAELVIGPLAPAALAELVADTLRTTSERCVPLAAAILEKSQGNPFFASELLTSLYRKGAIWLDLQQGQWTWDLGAVRNASATANVIELMVQRLASFPEATRAALKLAAHFGNTFSLGAVAGLLGSDVVRRSRQARQALAARRPTLDSSDECGGGGVVADPTGLRTTLAHHLRAAGHRAAAARSAARAAAAGHTKPALARARAGEERLRAGNAAKAGSRSASRAWTVRRGCCSRTTDVAFPSSVCDGGDVFVEFTGSMRDGHRPFRLVFVLPVTALAELAQSGEYLSASPRPTLQQPSDPPRMS